MENKLKIFVDCHVFDEGFQGTTTYLRGLYIEMIKNTAIDFYFASSNPGKLELIFGAKLNIHYLQYKSHNKFYRLLFDIPQLIKSNQIDFAHFQYIVPPLKYCKYINTVHDVLFLEYGDYFTWSYKVKNKILFKWSAQRSDIVLTVSPYSKDQIKKHFGIKKITVIPNAVDEVFFETYNKEAIDAEVKLKYGLQNYFIFISRWEARKNHALLLKVFVEQLYYKEYYLVLVGDKETSNEKFEILYNTLTQDIKSKVVMLNKIDFKDLILLVRGSQLSIYPSLAEGFGIPPLEAAAAGIPSVCSNTTAMADFDFLKDTLFNPLSEKDLTDKIEKGLHLKNTSVIKEQVRAKFNWAASADCLLKLIQTNILK